MFALLDYLSSNADLVAVSTKISTMSLASSARDSVGESYRGADLDTGFSSAGRYQGAQTALLLASYAAAIILSGETAICARC